MGTPAHHEPPDPLPQGALAGLTTAQRAAVSAPDPLVCLLAGAGSGKTRVMTLRIARRIADGSARPEHVVATTFSRKAAQELRERLARLADAREVTTGTFHRLALSLIRRHHADRLLAAPQVTSERSRLLAEALAAPGGRSRGAGAPSGLLAALEAEISWAKSQLVSPERYPEAAARANRALPVGPDRVAEAYQSYETLRRRRRVLDFDDLLLACGDLLDQDLPFAQAVRWRYRHLFVDEMQDVNPAQFRLVTSLLGDEPDLFVVGDPHQSVYAWNGADPTLLARLPQILPGIRVLRLDHNHRSSPQVLAVAAAALGPAADALTSTRPDGPLPQVLAFDHDQAEASFLADQLRFERGALSRWSHMAVLARTNHQLRRLAATFDQRGIPVLLAGRDTGPASDLPPPEPAGDLGTPLPQIRDHQTPDPPPDGVVLSTFHRAKGLQWPTVFVTGLSADLVPHASARTPAARDEERRLLYVALSRAQDTLWCTWARRRSGPSGPLGPTRGPSPWLAPVEQACQELAARAAPAGPQAVSRRIADLRAQIAQGPGGHPTEALG